MNEKTKRIATVGVFAALSTVLYFLKFNIPIFPPFLKIQFSNLPIIIMGFALGPKQAIIVLAIKTVIGGIFSFGSSFAIGELSDFLIGLGVVLVSSFVYRRHKTRKGGALALFCGTITWVLIAIPVNWLVIVPVYIKLYFGGNVDSFVAACSIIPGITEANYMKYYIIAATIPFNAMLATMVSIVTFIVYKRVSNFIKPQEVVEKKK